MREFTKEKIWWFLFQCQIVTLRIISGALPQNESFRCFYKNQIVFCTEAPEMIRETAREPRSSKKNPVFVTFE